MIQIPMMTQSEQKKNIPPSTMFTRSLSKFSPCSDLSGKYLAISRILYNLFPHQTILYYFQKYASQFAVENKDNIVSIYVHNISVQTILFSQESDRPPSYPGIDTTLASRSSIAASGHSRLKFEKKCNLGMPQKAKGKVSIDWHENMMASCFPPTFEFLHSNTSTYCEKRNQVIEIIIYALKCMEVQHPQRCNLKAF